MINRKKQIKETNAGRIQTDGQSRANRWITSFFRFLFFQRIFWILRDLKDKINCYYTIENGRLGLDLNQIQVNCEFYVEDSSMILSKFFICFFLKGEMKARGFSGIPQRIVPRIMPDKTHRKQCNVGWTQTGRCKRTDPIQIFNPNLSLDRSTFDIRQPKLDASDKSIDESAVDCRLKKYYLVASPSATKPRRRSSSSASSCRPFRSFHHLPRQKKII